jgi:hypothetical protein
MSIEKYSSAAINASFLDQVESPEGQAALADRGAQFIRRKLREEAISRKILPPQTVTKLDITRSETSDTVIKIVDIEPDSKAMALNLRSQPNGKYIEGERYSIPFFKISSEKYEKSEEELIAFETPVIKLIERSTVKEIQDIEDTKFFEYCEAAIAISGLKLDTLTGDFVDREAIASGIALLPQGKLRCDTIVMSEETWTDILKWPSGLLGDALASKVTVDGYTYNQFMGKKLVISIKRELLPKGEIWFFAEQQYLGNFFVLGSTKFFLEKRASIISWEAWETVGIGIGNINGVAKIEFQY